MACWKYDSEAYGGDWLSLSVLKHIEFPDNIFEHDWGNDTVSPITLNTFKECPFKFECKTTEAPTIEVDMTYADFGTAVHNAIAAIYKSFSHDSWLTPDGFRERVEAYIYKIQTVPRGKSLKKIVENLCKFEQWRRRRYPSESQLPKAIELVFKVPPFHGIIDFAAHDFILDWKTGQGSHVSEDYITQVNAYFYAGVGLGFSPKKGFLNFVETGMKPMVPINLEKLLKEAFAFFELTSSPSFVYEAIPNSDCRWCEYAAYCQSRQRFSHEFICSVLIQKRISRLRSVGLY